MKYKIRMWDTNPEDPHGTHQMPFEGTGETFVAIVASPLIAGIVDGASDFMTRGGEQKLSLEPYKNSFDPDEPEAEV